MLETNVLYRRAFETDSKAMIYEIPSNQIQVGAVIGQGQECLQLYRSSHVHNSSTSSPGAFGMVCMGTVIGMKGFGRPTTVAVKQLNANAEDFQRSEFTAEIEIMKQVGSFTN